MGQIQYIKTIHLTRSCDVLVLGGGIAGVCAACAAAAEGMHVILVEQYAITGGNCTAGGVAAFCGETAGQGRIFDEIIRRLTECHAIEPYLPYKHMQPGEARTFNHHMLAFVLQEMLLAYRVEVILHTKFMDSIVQDNGRITHCLIDGKSGLEAIDAKVVIDTTGDGDVAARAGFRTMKGDPHTGLQLPMSMMFFVKYLQQGSHIQEVPGQYFNQLLTRETLPMVSVWPDGNDGRSIKVKIPGFDPTDTTSLTQAELYARKRCMQILEYIQRTENPVLRDHTRWIDSYGLAFGSAHNTAQSDVIRYASCSPQIGIREGRRILGDYLLTVDDVCNCATFEDAIAKGTFYLDVHSSKDDKLTYAVDKKTMLIDPYQIPLRSLIVKDGENLLSAGRCFSCDQLALGSARVTTTCAMMGQAAGLLAARAAYHNISPRAIDPLEIRKTLESYGAKLDL